MNTNTQTQAVEPNDAHTVIAQAAFALFEVIEAHGLSGIPSGHLYARVMGHMSLEIYECLIDLLTAAGKISNKGHLLIAL